ncbi:integral membrane ornithine transporter of mitochondria [Pyricularia oryzae Y34]|uniref:Integral membrane ornithine transporter of mitochondria n=2 Tax=Pyricularia oryzae TaxID=318829 RepID=A0AA97NYH3_PYRO3|nr:integral membrane ornithine transporter of mitochondria [Pyricularia oryzae Y34]
MSAVAAAAAQNDDNHYGQHDHKIAWPSANMPSYGGGKNSCAAESEEQQSIKKVPTLGRDGQVREQSLQQKEQHQAKNPALRFAKRYRTEVAASMSSALSTAAAFPLDSVKTRMQTYKYSGFIDCVRHTYQTEKLRGFFRGVTAPMISITAEKFGVDVVGHMRKSGNYPNFWTVSTIGAAGATGGSLITVLACPFELSKLSAQVSVLLSDRKNCPNPKDYAVAASYQNKGTWQTMKNIVRHRGYSGLYTGFSLHLLRDTLGTGLYFMTYESAKQILTSLSGTYQSNPLPVLISGGLCGIVSWALIYPIDSAKSIYQRNALMRSKGQTVEPVKIQFFQKHMYRGLGVSMGRSCAVNAIFFSVFELAKKRIKSMDEGV